MGFARRTDESVTPQPSGTLAYMAPEVKLNTVHDPRRADIYSLGVLLHEILYGVLPGEEGTKGFPGGSGGMALSPIIKKCIDFDPHKRFESAAALKKELFAAIPFAGHEMQPQLGKTVEPLLRERMHRCCLEAAAGMMNKRKEDAYHLICEALDWDPESSEALAMLQKIRSSSTRPRTSLFIAVAAGISALGVAGFFPLKNRTSFSPPSHEVVLTGKKEYLEPRRPRSSAGVPVGIPLRVKLDETRFSARIDVRDIPSDATLFLDDSILRSGGSRAQCEVTAGVHVLHIRNSSGIIWRQRIEPSPFETLRLQVRTTEP
jgi:serine/threonine protein kinase